MSSLRRYEILLPLRFNDGQGGPMVLDELTSYKWLGYGNGQVRI